MHSRQPRLRDAQSGLGAPQSQQQPLPGTRLRAAAGQGVNDVPFTHVYMQTDTSQQQPLPGTRLGLAAGQGRAQVIPLRLLQPSVVGYLQ